MSLILIGFGGTGAKMVRAFLMASAAGAFNLPTVKVLLVDQDKGNGNTADTVATLHAYLAARSLLPAGGTAARPFSVDCEIYADPVWQPLRSDQSLGKWFGYDEHATGRVDLNSLFLEALYSEPQIKETLDKGFLGNPNIGAPVFADTIDFENEPWKRLDEDVAQGVNGSGTRIVLCGSVFGGTGASGIPNTAKLLRERLNEKHNKPDHGHAKIILNLAMPYFSVRQVDGAGLQVAGHDFLPNCKAALRYYHEQNYLDFCDAIYVLGERALAPIEVAELGDSKQRNAAHPLELFAACNIADAFTSNDLNQKLVLTRRASHNAYRWQDLPLNASFMRARMGAFARACYALLMYQEGIERYAQDERNVRENVWIKRFFPASNDVRLDEHKILNDFAVMFLHWIGEMELTAATMPCPAEWFASHPLVEGDPRHLNVRPKRVDAKGAEWLNELLLPKVRSEDCSHRDFQRFLNEEAKKRSASPGFGHMLTSFYQRLGRDLPGFAG